MPEKKKEYFDNQYIIKFKSGDTSAFDVIYSYYKNHIYWMGISFFSNEEMAKDLVQAVFLKIYQSIKDLREPDGFYVWMNRIAYTQCLQMVRYNKKDSSYYTSDMGESYMEEFVKDDMAENVLTELQKEQVNQIIIDALEKLPAETRTICYLRLFEELTWQQVSEITKKPEGTVSSTFSRIKPVLKKALQKNGITGSSCLSLLLLPNISQYFKAFMDIKEPLSIEASTQVLNEVHQSVYMKKKAYSKKSWQLPAYGLIGLAVIVPAVAILTPNDTVPSSILLGNTEDAVISNLSYPQKLTNSSFKVYVETTNENYDKILLNDQESLMIQENGEYTLTLLRTGKVIDEKKFTISNIDKDVPIVTGQVFVDGVITIHVDDTDSRIDYDKIQYYENGVLTNNFTLNKDKQEIYINDNSSKDNLLEITDIAGNVLKAKVIFYEINAENSY